MDKLYHRLLDKISNRSTKHSDDGNEEKQKKFFFELKHLLNEQSMLSAPVPIIAWIQENKAIINSKDENGDTALHWILQCPQNPNPNIVRVLIESGINIEARNNSRRTALHIAFQHLAYDTDEEKENSDCIIALLLQHAININAPDVIGQRTGPVYYRDIEGNTLLGYALKRNLNFSHIQTLIEKNANINAKDDRGNPLILSLFHYKTDQKKKQEIMELFLQTGEKIELNTVGEDGQTLLYRMIKHEFDFKIIQTCLEKVADTKDKQGNKLVFNILTNYRACMNRENYIKTVELFLQREQTMDINIHESSLTSINQGGRTVLSWLIIHKFPFKIIQAYIEKGADVNIRDQHRRTLLHLAESYLYPYDSQARQDSKKIVKLLVQKGVDVNATDDMGRTACHNILSLVYSYDTEEDKKQIRTMFSVK